MLLRLVVIGMIGLAITARLSVTENYEHDVLKGAHDTLIEAGLEILPASQIWQANYGSVRVRPPGCDEDVAIIPFPIMIDPAAMRRVTETEADATRILYFDKTWPKQIKPALFLSLIRQRARYALGLSGLYPSSHALLLAGSPNCLSVFPVNLAGSWRKRPQT